MFFARLDVSAIAVAVLLAAHSAAAEPVQVNSDNFIRPESDLYFSAVAARGRFGKFGHDREMTPLDKQAIIRMNRDTLYSSAVFDLDAGPVTVTLPDTGGRFMSMQVFDQNHYTHGVYYKPGTYTLTREEIGTRYVFPGIRILVNPEDPKDMTAVHDLQDKITAEQPGGPGKFEIPIGIAPAATRLAQSSCNWASRCRTRLACSVPRIRSIRFAISLARPWLGAVTLRRTPCI